MDNIDHCALGEKTLKAPYKPKLENSLDTSCFDSVITNQSIRLTVVDPHKSLDENFQFLAQNNGIEKQADKDDLPQIIEDSDEERTVSFTEEEYGKRLASLRNVLETY